MPRFLPEYKEVDTRSSSEKIILGISLLILFLFMPATVLGYFAEKSLPGQPLYGVKRGIESAVLAIESVSPYSKSLYYQTLAQNRVTETSTLIAEAAATGNTADLTQQTNTSLNDAYVSIQQAAVSIQTITDPVEKKKAQAQLAVSIQTYQTQLSQMTYTIQKNITTTSPTPTPTNAAATNTQVTPTPTPDPATALQNQINQTQNNLQTISNTLQTVPTDTPIPTPTPTPTATPTPTPTPTPIPWWKQRNQQQSGD